MKQGDCMPSEDTMKRIIGILLVFEIIACCAFLSACGVEKQGDYSDYSTDFTQSTPPTVGIDDGYTFSISEGRQDIKEGALLFTVRNPRIVNRKQDIPEGGFRDDSYSVLPKEKGEIVYYPDFIEENGNFTEGVYLLLVDVRVYSDNATAYTKNDLDSGGVPRSLYDDPFFFRADPLINVCTTPYYIERESQFYCMDFYSLMGQCDVHPNGFRLEPQQEICFTVGFILDDIQFGGRMDLSKISLCHTMGGGAEPYIQINLGEN